MHIRRGDETDIEIVTELIRRFFAAEGFSTPTGVIAARAPEMLTGRGNAVMLAFDDDLPIGIATVSTRFGFESGRLAEIEDLFVVPEHRGNGVATALLGETMLWCRHQGYEELEVVVTPEEAERQSYLIAWYGRLGFSDTSRRVLHFGEKRIP